MQSWFHSQKVNVMMGSSELVGEWLRGIDVNQNTRLYGRVSNKDGIWRNGDGEVILGLSTVTVQYGCTAVFVQVPCRTVGPKKCITNGRT
jgi:hypothetical protein